MGCLGEPRRKPRANRGQHYFRGVGVADSNGLSRLQDVDTQLSFTRSKAASLIEDIPPAKAYLLPETCPVLLVVESPVECLKGCDDYVLPWVSSFLNSRSRPLIVVATAVVCERNETGELGSHVEPFVDHGPWTTYELGSVLNICQSGRVAGRCCDMGCVRLMYPIRGRPGAQEEREARIHTKISVSRNGPPIAVRARFFAGHSFPNLPTFQA